MAEPQRITVEDAMEREQRMMGRDVDLVRTWGTDVRDAQGGWHEVLILIYDASTDNDYQTRIATYIDGRGRDSSIVANGGRREE